MTQVNVTLVLHSLVSRQLLETLRCKNGEGQHLDYHQARVERSLTQLGVKTYYNLATLVSPPNNDLYRCRIAYDEKTIDITYLPYTKRNIVTLQIVHANTLVYDLKYADRTSLNTLFEKRGKADDILIIQNGLVTDTTIANIAFYDGKQWLTPTKPLLHGTTRARLIHEKKIIEAEIHAKELANYLHFALMNAMIGFSEIKNGIILPLKGDNDVI